MDLHIPEPIWRVSQWVVGQDASHYLTWYAHIPILSIVASAPTVHPISLKISGIALSPVHGCLNTKSEVLCGDEAEGRISTAYSFHAFVESFLTGRQPRFQLIGSASEDCSGPKLGRGLWLSIEQLTSVSCPTVLDFLFYTWNNALGLSIMHLSTPCCINHFHREAFQLSFWSCLV